MSMDGGGEEAAAADEGEPMSSEDELARAIAMSIEEAEDGEEQKDDSGD